MFGNNNLTLLGLYLLGFLCYFALCLMVLGALMSVAAEVIGQSWREASCV